MKIVKDRNNIPLGAEVLIRVPRSHRGRERFEQALGRKPQYWFSFRFDGHFAFVNGHDFERVKGQATRARRVDVTKLLQCW